jgi:light-regulated signal transduction histidine kinase (bacteriophytochrome)
VYRWHLTRCIPIKDDKGKIIKWVGTTTDVHDQMAANEELERKVARRTEELVLTNLELSRSNEDLEQFAYVASHDMKEPLRMVASYVSLLERSIEEKLTEDEKEFLNYIVSGASRMQNLIRDLLNYSRITKQKLTSEPINCIDIIEDVKGNLERVIDESGAQITISNLPPVFGIRTQLVQLFQNLVANALKFRKPHLSPFIEISARAEGNEWLFSIKDNGIGIKPEYRDRIFVIFQRLHVQSSQYNGTGIGLAVCKRIVSLHGGRIWMESDGENGSTFYFTLPRL